MFRFSTNIVNRLCFYSLLSALPVGMAQAGSMNLCSANGPYSVAVAQDLILQGDAIMQQTPDCVGANWNRCSDAATFYLDAAYQLNEVMTASTGNNCLRCDPTSVGNYAQLLQDRQNHMASLGFTVTSGYVYNEYWNWKDEPYCTATGVPPVAPPPIVSPNPPSTIPPAVQSCTPIRAYHDRSLNYAGHTYLYNMTSQSCADECTANQWCKSFDFYWSANSCVLFDVTMDQVVLELMASSVSHYECEGRY